MTMPTRLLLSLELPSDPQAPATVRAALAELHDANWSLSDAQLIASELITNAVLHSGATEAHTLTVEVSRREDALIISVNDPGISGQDAHPRAEGRASGGWGLLIVGQLARRWGTE